MISVTVREIRNKWQEAFWVIHGHTGSNLWSLVCRLRFGTQISTLGYADKFVLLQILGSVRVTLFYIR